MTRGQYGHQKWLATMQTPIPSSFPATGFNGSSYLAGLRTQLTNILQNFVSVSNFASQGGSLATVKQASVSNVSFPVNSNGFMTIQFNVDTYTDLTWIDYTELGLFLGGLAVGIAAFLTGDPLLAFLAGLLIVAAFTLAVYEVFREVVACLGQGLTCLLQNLSPVSFGVILVGGLAILALLKRPRRGQA